MEYKIHTIPSLLLMEFDIPMDLVDNLNSYLDKYLEDKKRKSLADTLVGQIHQGEQLLMDHEDEKVIEFSKLLCGLSAEYINTFAKVTDIKYKYPKQITVDELWSVHSYEGDYNPIHNHGVKTLMGVSCTTWTKVPPQISEKEDADTLYNSSGAYDGYICFNYGKTSITDTETLTPPTNFNLKPTVGKLYIFPSWLQHMVYPFRGEGERRTVAANLNCWDMIPEEDIKKIEEAQEKANAA